MVGVRASVLRGGTRGGRQSNALRSCTGRSIQEALSSSQSTSERFLSDIVPGVIGRPPAQLSERFGLYSESQAS